LAWGTDTPAKSNKYQKGLYHGKTHGQRRKRCFSMKYSLHTMKPNVLRKTLHSEILKMDFRLWISTKARKCIMKAGSLDSYLIRTKPEQIDSRMGLYLRHCVLSKIKSGSFKVPYIPGQASIPKTRRTKKWEYRQLPTIYMPANVRVAADHTKYYIKTPQEMSRYEIAELELELRQINEPEEVTSQDQEDLTAQQLIDQVADIPEFIDYQR